MLKHYITRLSAKFDNVSSTFFVYTLAQKIFPSQTLLEQWHSSLGTQFIWRSLWLGWKAIYVETLYNEFLSAKFDNVSSTFFVYTLAQKFFPSRTVLGQWHSSLDSQFIWISPWLGWKAIYVETPYSEFLSAKFDNVSSTFFVCHLGQEFFPYQTVLGQWHSSLDSQFIWISPWLGGKAIYVETLYSEFLSSKFDNVSGTFFVYHLGQKLFSSQTVLGQWHSSLDPQFIWISPWLGWKAIYVETLYNEFLSAKFDNVSSTFFVYTLAQKFFPSQTVLGQWHFSLDSQFIWISPWLGWKVIFVETLYSEFLRAKFDNVSSTFFVYHLGQKFFPSQTLLEQWHSSLGTQFIWIGLWLGWKAIYVETLYNEFLSAKFDNLASTFFVYTLAQKFFPSLNLLEQWHSSLGTQFIWISLWLGWKAIYVQTLYNEFLSAKFDNVSSTFFLYTLALKFFPSQTVLGQWHSSLDPQFIWISPWLGWKAIYVETLYNEFLSAKFDNVSSTFFVYTLAQKFFPSQTVLGQWHFSLDSQFIWISPWLGWKVIFVETLYSEFLRAKFDNVSSTFFVYHLGQKFFPSQTLLEQWHSSLGTQFIWIGLWLGWKAIYVETLYNEFLSAKFDNLASTFFVYTLAQKFFPSLNLLEQWHSSLGTQFIWISLWLGWKAIYVQTLYNEFLSAKFDNVSSTFFLYTLALKFFPSQTVLGQWHSSLDSQFIGISPWLGWKAIYVETPYSEFLSAKFDNVSSTFFVCHLGQEFFPYQTVLGQWHSSLGTQFIWISLWLGWKAVYVETLYNEFLSAKFDNLSSTFFIYTLAQKFFPSQTLLEQWHSSLGTQFIWISLWLGWKALCWNTI